MDFFKLIVAADMVTVCVGNDYAYGFTREALGQCSEIAASNPGINQKRACRPLDEEHPDEILIYCPIALSNLANLIRTHDIPSFKAVAAR
jgi:hypothetical protein